ncbi:HlyD family efflux transporter periplasmic adaptor subunit [Acetobacteraceae bacterium H6797]|nr:HlyD family efflux transporter periplasmic adaptor subunit [Acetobacteraceae bacterium H6797]
MEHKTKDSVVPAPSTTSPASKAEPAPPPPAQTGGRGRLLRIGAGVLALAVALLFLYDRFFTVSAGNAVLSGAPFTLRAPIEGTLDANERLPGALMEQGQSFGRIVNERLDDSRHAELSTNIIVAEGELSAIAQRLAGVNGQLEAMQRSGGAFRDARAAQLQERLKESEATLKAAQARLREAEQAVARSDGLLRAGLTTRVAAENFRRDLAMARVELRTVAERHSAVVAEEQGAQAGIFTADSATDRSITQQTEDRLKLNQIELQALQSEKQARLAAMRAQLQREQQRIGRLRDAALMVPARGRMVRLRAQNGEFLRQGQDIADFIECGRPIVTAELDERAFRALRLGQQAVFTAAGEKEEHRGTVMQLLPPMLSPAETRGTFLVVVRVDPLNLASSCEVGRVGTLRFR